MVEYLLEAKKFIEHARTAYSAEARNQDHRRVVHYPRHRGAGHKPPRQAAAKPTGQAAAKAN
jgi:hypothetical protein